VAYDQLAADSAAMVRGAGGRTSRGRCGAPPAADGAGTSR
jgi:hypothetical protein